MSWVADPHDPNYHWTVCQGRRRLMRVGYAYYATGPIDYGSYLPLSPREVWEATSERLALWVTLALEAAE